MVEVMEVDDYMSLFFVVNHSPDHEAGRYKQYGLIYLLHIALYVENVSKSGGAIGKKVGPD